MSTKRANVKNAPASSMNRKLHLLELIPGFALREILESRLGADDDKQRARSARMTHEELVKQIESTSSISEEEIRQVFEDYRYGQRVSLQLYLFDPQQPLRLSATDLRNSMRKVLGLAENAEAENVDAEIEEYESEELLSKIDVRDEDEFDGTIEIGYKYLVRHNFLDENEEQSFVYQTRFGFLWLNYDQGHLAILARDDRITNLVGQALSQVLKFWPTKIKFPKEILDEHFPLESARRVTHLDPDTHVRHTVSGKVEGLRKYRAEIKRRDKASLRPGALYDQELEPGYISGVGVTSSKGQIFLTRNVSATRLRRWAMDHLSSLVADLRDHLSNKPDQVALPSPAVRRLHLSTQARIQVDQIISYLIRLKKEHRSSVNLQSDSLGLFRELGARVTPFILVECDKCGEIGDRCPECQHSAFAIRNSQIVCGNCGCDLVSHDQLRLRCLNGHRIQTPLSDALGVKFSDNLFTAIISALRDAKLDWDEDHECFYVQGNTLHYVIASSNRPIEIIKGDKIIAKIGPGARQVAVGKNITQSGGG